MTQFTHKVTYIIKLREGSELLPELKKRLAEHMEQAAHKTVVEAFAALDNESFGDGWKDRMSPIADLESWTVSVSEEDDQEEPSFP